MSATLTYYGTGLSEQSTLAQYSSTGHIRLVPLTPTTFITIGPRDGQPGPPYNALVAHHWTINGDGTLTRSTTTYVNLPTDYFSNPAVGRSYVSDFVRIDDSRAFFVGTYENMAFAWVMEWNGASLQQGAFKMVWAPGTGGSAGRYFDVDYTGTIWASDYEQTNWTRFSEHQNLIAVASNTYFGGEEIHIFMAMAARVDHDLNDKVWTTILARDWVVYPGDNTIYQQFPNFYWRPTNIIQVGGTGASSSNQFKYPRPHGLRHLGSNIFAGVYHYDDEDEEWIRWRNDTDDTPGKVSLIDNTDLGNFPSWYWVGIGSQRNGDPYHIVVDSSLDIKNMNTNATASIANPFYFDYSHLDDSADVPKEPADTILSFGHNNSNTYYFALTDFVAGNSPTITQPWFNSGNDFPSYGAAVQGLPAGTDRQYHVVATMNWQPSLSVYLCRVFVLHTPIAGRTPNLRLTNRDDRGRIARLNNSATSRQDSKARRIAGRNTYL